MSQHAVPRPKRNGSHDAPPRQSMRPRHAAPGDEMKTSQHKRCSSPARAVKVNDLFDKMPQYDARYDSTRLRGISEQRPWNIVDEVLALSGRNKALLDIGCGTAFKLVALVPHFDSLTGLDLSRSMVDAARATLRDSGATTKVVEGNGEDMPFPDKTFDVVTAMLSRWCVSEIYRVLKPGGTVVIEATGGLDKADIKREFGDDADGPRGHRLGYGADGIRKLLGEAFADGFEVLDVRDGFWKTHYSREGLLELLQRTPTVRKFDIQKDRATFERIVETFSKNQQISALQHRVLLKARKI